MDPAPPDPLPLPPTHAPQPTHPTQLLADRLAPSVPADRLKINNTELRADKLGPSVPADRLKIRNIAMLAVKTIGFRTLKLAAFAISPMCAVKTYLAEP